MFTYRSSTHPSHRISQFIKACDLVLAGMFLGLIVGAALAAPGQLNFEFERQSATTEQPYGGCDEAWQAPTSEGAKWCRQHGWTVRERIVVGPRNWVRYSTLPSCEVEDASSGPVPCSWNFGTTDGNGKGDPFYALRPLHKNDDARIIIVRGVR